MSPEGGTYSTIFYLTFFSGSGAEGFLMYGAKISRKNSSEGNGNQLQLTSDPQILYQVSLTLIYK